MKNNQNIAFSIHEVDASDVTCEINVWSYFATISIEINKHNITLFTKTEDEAKAILNKLLVAKTSHND
jgi:hypothetical protein